MKIIEQKMLQAIQEHKNFKLSNTEVQTDENCINIFLHNHLIACIDRNVQAVFVYSRGYRTNTTKSRLNAVLSITNCRVVQNNFKWYFVFDSGNRRQFREGDKIYLYTEI